MEQPEKKGEYYIQFELFRESLIKECKQKIAEKWNDLDWFFAVDYYDLEFFYLDEANKHFGHRYSVEFGTELYNKFNFAAKNLVFAIEAYMAHNKNTELNDVLEFMEQFMIKQLRDFYNWAYQINISFD